LKKQRSFFEEVDRESLLEVTEEEIHNEELSQQITTIPGKNSLAYQKYLKYVEGIKDVAVPFSFEEFMSSTRDLDLIFS
jgi:hypothetical protein